MYQGIVLAMIQWNDHYDEQIKALTDAELLEAYERTSGKPGDAAVDALVAEVRLRGLDL